MTDFKEDKIEWNFKALNPHDYEIWLKCEIQSKLFEMAFSNIRKEMEKKQKEVIDTKIMNQIEGFDIPEEHLLRYGFLFKTNTRKQFAYLRMDLLKDGIQILNNEIKRMRFEKIKESGNWIVTLYFEGRYLDKR